MIRMAIEVKQAGEKGKGVFAASDFVAGDIVLQIDMTAAIDKEDILFLPQEDQNHTMFIGNGRYIVMKAPECYINHSCEPNCYVKNKDVIARRNIKKGEEITTDYSLTSKDPWEMVCHCKSNVCRNVIKGDLLKMDKRFREENQIYL